MMKLPKAAQETTTINPQEENTKSRSEPTTQTTSQEEKKEEKENRGLLSFLSPKKTEEEKAKEEEGREPITPQMTTRQLTTIAHQLNNVALMGSDIAVGYFGKKLEVEKIDKDQRKGLDQALVTVLQSQKVALTPIQGYYIALASVCLSVVTDKTDEEPVIEVEKKKRGRPKGTKKTTNTPKDKTPNESTTGSPKTDTPQRVVAA